MPSLFMRFKIIGAAAPYDCRNGRATVMRAGQVVYFAGIILPVKGK
jgi:hypothetical protein